MHQNRFWLGTCWVSSQRSSERLPIIRGIYLPIPSLPTHHASVCSTVVTPGSRRHVRSTSVHFLPGNFSGQVTNLDCNTTTFSGISTYVQIDNGAEADSLVRWARSHFIVVLCVAGMIHTLFACYRHESISLSWTPSARVTELIVCYVLSRVLICHEQTDKVEWIPSDTI